MDSAVLFSGGKDSTLALDYALRSTNVKCLISVFSESNESFMFHTPNIHLVKELSESIGIPLFTWKTKGVKEEELLDLENALKAAKEKFKIQAVFTGALASNYQASRIQKICDSLALECINPLWQKDQFAVLQELQERKISAIVVGVFAQGLENFLGRKIDSQFIKDIRPVVEKYSINPAGEGGEIESLVLDAPFFKKRFEIVESTVIEDKEGGKVLKIGKLNAVKK